MEIKCKVIKILKTVTTTTLGLSMILPMGVINATVQNNSIIIHHDEIHHVATQIELKNKEQQLLNQINTKINQSGGLLKISKEQLKNDVNRVFWFNENLSSSVYNFENSLKNFTNEIIQDKLFYEIRSQMMSSRIAPVIIGALITAGAVLLPQVPGWINNTIHSGDHRWTHSNGHWWYCNGWGQYCATDWQRLHSPHQNYNHGGNRLYLFNSSHALNDQSGWKKYNNHYMYNDGRYGFLTNEGANIQKNNYTNVKAHFHFNNHAYKV